MPIFRGKNQGLGVGAKLHKWEKQADAFGVPHFCRRAKGAVVHGVGVRCGDEESDALGMAVAGGRAKGKRAVSLGVRGAEKKADAFDVATFSSGGQRVKMLIGFF